MIDNPAYKGEWAPRKIANPDYFEDLTPVKSLEKIVGQALPSYFARAHQFQIGWCWYRALDHDGEYPFRQHLRWSLH